MTIAEIMAETRTTRGEMNDMKALVRKLYKNKNGQPFEMTDGQSIIFACIFKRKFPRIHIETHTRYGKSEIISLAVLTRATTFPERTAIVAGKKDKAGIIMSYLIGHIFDNEYCRKRFLMEGESEENIRRYRNKDKINFDLGGGLLGEVYICSAQDALGWGAKNVVEDEAALVPTSEHSLVIRMLGDDTDNFLCKVGNPWDEEHFNKSRESDNYKKIIIGYPIGIKEGRITPEFIDEARREAFFDVLYECESPKSAVMDKKAWIPLFTREEVANAMVESRDGFGVNKLGVDVAGGGRNFSVIVQRHTNIAKKIYKTHDPDTMNLVEAVVDRMELDKLPNSNVGIDKVGIGNGAYDMLNRLKPGVWGVDGGNEASDKEKFFNLRAELAWKVREWILGGGKLERDDDWFELCRLKYRSKLVGKQTKMVLISKEELAKEGIDSPDCYDALAMTFITLDIIFSDYDKMREEEMNRSRDPHNPFFEI